MQSFVGFGYHSGEQKSMVGRISNIQRVGMVETSLLETEKERERERERDRISLGYRLTGGVKGKSFNQPLKL